MKKSLLITAAILMGTAGYASADNGKPTTFAEMDTNGDMVISKDEAQGRLLANFDKLDLDGNGTLSKNEMPRGKQGKSNKQGKGSKQGRDNKGPNFADLDKNGDNVLSQDEVQGRMLDNFAQLDKDGNGTLSQDEMPRGKHPRGQKGPNFADLDKNGDNVLSQSEVRGRMLDNFAQLDKDGNGTLSQDEMPQAKGGHQHKRPTFADLDTNKDGSLSEAEYNIQPKGHKAKGHQGQYFQKMDKNSDGVLDKTEVRGRLLANFDQLDADNNGTLSPEELPSKQK